MRYRLTVNQGKIKAGEADCIHVHDTFTEERFDCREAFLTGPSRLKWLDDQAQDGARVILETDTPPDLVQ